MCLMRRLHPCNTFRPVQESGAVARVQRSAGHGSASSRGPDGTVSTGGVMAVRIGTSGFIYEHWRGRFYPPSARGSELEHYAGLFDTVELNVTFYRMPSAATFRSWAARVPEGFLFAVKASRYLTHIKRLREPEDSVKFLVERASELGSHLGPILLQLPPDMPADIPRLGGRHRGVPGLDPAGRGTPARIVVHRRAPSHADRAWGGPLLGRSTWAADTDVADGRLDLPALPRRSSQSEAMLRRTGTGHLVDACPR